MKPRELLLRCYANKYGDQQQAFCIDFGLAAQGDSYEEVKAKLSDMIREYLYDALVGEDKEYAEQLLQRKAPFKQIATYYWYSVLYHLGVFRNEFHKLFKLPQALLKMIQVNNFLTQI